MVLNATFNNISVISWRERERIEYICSKNIETKLIYFSITKLLFIFQYKKGHLKRLNQNLGMVVLVHS